MVIQTQYNVCNVALACTMCQGGYAHLGNCRPVHVLEHLNGVAGTDVGEYQVRGKGKNNLCEGRTQLIMVTRISLIQVLESVRREGGLRKRDIASQVD